MFPRCSRIQNCLDCQSRRYVATATWTRRDATGHTLRSTRRPRSWEHDYHSLFHALEQSTIPKLKALGYGASAEEQGFCSVPHSAIDTYAASTYHSHGVDEAIPEWKDEEMPRCILFYAGHDFESLLVTQPLANLDRVRGNLYTSISIDLMPTSRAHQAFDKAMTNFQHMTIAAPTQKAQLSSLLLPAQHLRTLTFEGRHIPRRTESGITSPRGQV